MKKCRENALWKGDTKMGYKHLKFPEDSLFLVTGAAGFIGSNLCEAILDMGYHVRALDDLSTGKQKNIDMFLDNPNYEFMKMEYDGEQPVYKVDWKDIVLLLETPVRKKLRLR